ncbi:DNA polymerase III subunit beta [Polymorphobacter fuscus]|uniref:Beta sliding clamp n=1 Tax=Sandarakinorhabdus fusca TaxID=1439888 RepID=A0A7C9GW60_9SPHN|nr:DNA polymerase III subunit beta [Polymorphobacter fuscus]KAB7646505.1 DNA polymerase III subunit beta [Polymorphobacter fuscus]MQT17749.1 DNA polymerase III subunit beta [Polymorphobacter fuscus]NJC09703.1 DNA polymerase-3 subunit beta [Polymorphobacter fuscus]
MKATVERATLLKCLAHIQSVVERRNTIPILSNVLIEARSEGLRLMATDLDLQVVETIAATIDINGATTVSAHTLFDIVRKLPEGSQVEIAVAADKMTVVANRSRFSLATLKRDDFPVIAETDLPTAFALPAKDLRELIDSTRFAISTEETRYYLNGIYLHAIDGKLRAVATDGHRLARIEIDLPEGARDMPGVIVPRKCVAEVRKLLDEYGDDAPIDISLSTSKIRFRFSAEATLTSKLIDGTFPDYSRVIPTANDKLLKIDAKSLSEGVDRVAAIATTEKTRAVKLSLAHDRVTLSVTSPENGTAAEEVPAEYAAAEFEVGFNYRYLLDILGQVGSDQVDVHLADAAAPTLIRENDDSRALYVLMPMRV